jgi:hypothetical protein
MYKHFLINVTPMPGTEQFSAFWRYCAMAATPGKSLNSLLDEAIVSEPIQWASISSVSVSLLTTFDHRLSSGSWIEYRSWSHRMSKQIITTLQLDWIGLDWIGLDWIGLDWIGLDWID